MEKAYQYIVENTASGKIPREIAIELLKMLKQTEKTAPPIAIIGMAARLPFANNPDQFWKNIRNKTDCIHGLPEPRRREIEKYLRYKKHPLPEIKYQEMGYLEDIDLFDNYFFRLSPKEASLMDPNQRLFLETVWSAIEDAGYGGRKLVGSKTGVYLGFSNNTRVNYNQIISEIDSVAAEEAISGNLSAIIASRISYLLDLKGPGLLIDTACSSSLVAIHLACQGLKNRDCNLAIVGGVKIELAVLAGDSSLGIMSSDGRTRAFDENSDGTGSGEGVVALLLKPLDKALKDADHIYAVIKGSAINQDGSSIGITAPNVTAQESVLCQAWESAGIDPETITYLEAHGTGTKLGDPIEIEGISRAFQRYTQKRQFCAIGSLKSNIGHLDHAAGIAGLLKAILALKYRELPPTIHFQQPNRKITFEDSPVYVNDRLIPWETGDFPRRAGVSAFGLSGANCHIVLEEAPPVAREKQLTTRPYIFTVSAQSLPALKNLLAAYREFFETAPESDLPGICYISNTGRGHYNYRLAIIANQLGGLSEKVHQLQAADLSMLNDPAVFYGRHQLIALHPDGAEAGYLTYEQKNQLDREANPKIEQITPDLPAAAYRDRLAELAGLYVRGADIPWDKIYAGEEILKLSIPTYVFERNHCWIRIPETSKPERLYYAVSWAESGLNPPANTPDTGAVLMINPHLSSSRESAAQWRILGAEIISVEMGTEFRKMSEADPSGALYQIDASQQSYEKLMQELKTKQFSRILYFVDQGKEPFDTQQFNQNQRRNLQGLLYLIQGLLQHHSNQPLELILIAEQVYRITGREAELNPEAAILFGLAKAVHLENPHLQCRCLDIDPAGTMDEVTAEIRSGSNSYLVAYRDGRRYVETIRELSLETISNHEITFDRNGVYLITGGTGGIGLEFAKYLARKQPLCIALLNRLPLPNRDTWDQLLTNSTDSKLKRKLKTIREIEQNGSRIACYQADVSKREELEPVIQEIRQKHGKIKGIIHAAGTGGGTLIAFETPESLEQVLAAKVMGTRILDQLTRQDEPDFLIMVSSAITIVSGIEAGGYTAANAYLDAYAGYRNHEGKRTLAVNWPAWKETGLAEGASLDESRQIFKALQPSQALEAFDQVFQKDIANVIIGELNFTNPVLSFMDHLPFHFSEALTTEIQTVRNQPGIPEQSSAQSAAVNLKGQTSGGYSEIQKQLAQIWGKVFGLNEVSIYTNFAELGGDSILAMNLTREIETVYPGVINITHIFSYPTIAEMAAFMENRLKNRDEPSGANALQILDRLNKGELSVDEVAQLMEKVGKNHGIN